MNAPDTQTALVLDIDTTASTDVTEVANIDYFISKLVATVTSQTTLERLKSAGDAPDWMNEEGFHTISKSYMQAGETPRLMYRRVAAAAAEHTYVGTAFGPSYWEQRFFEAMWNNWLCPASPVLANMGTTRGLSVSCNSCHPGDSVTSIFEKAHELAMLSKGGAGVGIYLGDIRGRGAAIKGNGRSEGIIPWTKIYDTTILSVNQGNTRRGAGAVFLPIEHSDIEEFINIRRPTGDMNRRCLNLNHGICIGNEWMQSMLDGDAAKRLLWQEVLKARVETGEPYLIFVDNINERNPDCYKQNNLKVSTSNICCLAGDTMVTTYEGTARIDALVGETVSIWDGERWERNRSFELKGEDTLLRIYLLDGTHVDCTSNHRWFATANYADAMKASYREMQASDLKPDMWLEPHYVDRDASAQSYEDWPRIVRLEKLEGMHKVYCSRVESTGKFALANGVMTGNSEIALHTDVDHTFVCCLSSLNLVRWEEWKDTALPALATRFLDAVLEEYIQRSEGMDMMEPARRSAIKGRAIGIGVLGWHTLLQERGLPFDSFGSMQLNAKVFKTIRTQAEAATTQLAKEKGEPEWCKGFGRRNTHLIAIAPTVSNSTISGGYSAGIEPISANMYTLKSAQGTFMRRNKTLETLLDTLGQNTDAVWKSILEQMGSVQHLACLNDEQKAVFLTARELNQHAIIKQAVQRQQWVDQAQSINLFFAANSSPKYVHEVHIEAWKAGLKTLYYLRTEGVLRGDLASRSKDECLACEG